MSIQHFAEALNGEASGHDRVLCPGPGHSANDRSLSVQFSPDGSFVCHSFAGDPWQDCKDHVTGLLGRDPFGLPAIAREPRKSEPPFNARKYAARLWRESERIKGTIAEKYLAGRGVLTDEAYNSAALRFDPECPFRLANGDLIRLPAMIGLMTTAADNYIRGVHRTALAPDGSGKANVDGLGSPKKMLGQSGGCVIRLSDEWDVLEGLHIAEGIETALAAMRRGYRPAWACTSAGNIANFPILSGVECLTILADNDSAGQRAAQQCAERWAAAGKEVIIRTPANHGDYAEVAPA